MQVIAIAVVVIVLVAIGIGARSGGMSTLVRSESERMRVPPRLESDLERWVAAGLITAEQAGAIAVHETEPRGPTRRISLATEAFGYVGAALATAGAMAGLSRVWEDFSPGLQLGVVGVGTVLLIVTGALTITQGEPALHRLGSLLWFLAVVAFAFALVILTLDIIGLRDEVAAETIALIVSSGAAIAAAVLWGVARTGLQQSALFVTIAAAGIAALNVPSGEPETWTFALGVWAYGLAWAGLGWLRRIEPWPVALALGSAAVLIGPALGIADHGWVLVPALATAAGAMAASLPTRLVPLLAGGTVGLFVYLTWAVVRYFGDTLGVPVALVCVGALFIVLAALAGRLRKMTLPSGPADTAS